MARNQVEELLGVNWFDGLLVASAHLEQSDRRMDGLLSETCGALIDQPGLVDDDGADRTPGPLIAVASEERTDDHYRIQLTVNRGFRAFSPGGCLVVALANAQPRAGIPAASLEATMPVGENEYIVCARQVPRGDLKIQRKVGDDSIELRYPGLSVETVEVGAYRQSAASDYGDAVAIGALFEDDGHVSVDTDYIPPVCRLQSVASFDDGLVSSIQTLFLDLFRLGTDLVRASTAASAQGKVGAEFEDRRCDYETLRTLMMAGVGTVRRMGRISPTTFLFDIMAPVAAWWRQYYEHHFARAAADATPVKKLYDLSGRVAGFDQSDVGAGTGEVLRASRKFLEGLNRELGMIG